LQAAGLAHAVAAQEDGAEYISLSVVKGRQSAIETSNPHLPLFNPPGVKWEWCKRATMSLEPDLDFIGNYSAPSPPNTRWGAER